MINIDVVSEDKNWSKKIRSVNFFFKSICKAFPKKYQFINKKILLTLLLSNNKKIKLLNKRYRKKNKATDILSFPFQDKIKNKNKVYLSLVLKALNFGKKVSKNPIFFLPKDLDD